AGLIEYVEEGMRSAECGIRNGWRIGLQCVDRVSFDDGVRENAGGNLFDLCRRQIALQDERAGGADLANRRQAQRPALVRDTSGFAIDRMCRLIDLNFPEHDSQMTKTREVQAHALHAWVPPASDSHNPVTAHFRSLEQFFQRPDVILFECAPEPA